MFCFLAKSQEMRAVGKAAIVPVCFAVNEPLLFAAPIVLNPVFFVPFVFAPIANVWILKVFIDFLGMNGFMYTLPWTVPGPIGTIMGLGFQPLAFVMLAIILMMVFIDPISDFINTHTEMKILALVFITVIGVLLVLDGLGINSGIEVLDMHAEKLMVYFAMVFAIVLEVIQMRYNKNYQEWTMRKNLEIMRARGYDPQNTDTIQLANALIEAENLKKDPNNKEAI